METVTKLVVILDRATCITAFCSKHHPTSMPDARILKREGFGNFPENYTFFYVPVLRWGDYDPYRCPDDYTVGTALVWAREHWDEFESGDAIDSEYLRGERDTPRTFEDEYDWEPPEGAPEGETI